MSIACIRVHIAKTAEMMLDSLKKKRNIYKIWLPEFNKKKKEIDSSLMVLKLVKIKFLDKHGLKRKIL